MTDCYSKYINFLNNNGDLDIKNFSFKNINIIDYIKINDEIGNPIKYEYLINNEKNSM